MAGATVARKNPGGGGKMPPCNAIRGRRPELQNCRIGDLLVDATYQRGLENKTSRRLIAAIARDWDWRLYTPLAVARRRDRDAGEALYVFDGQHRLAAARLRGDLYDLPCFITESSGADDEARAFLAINRQRRPLSTLDLFKADLASGSPDEVRLMNLIAAAGLDLATHTNWPAWKPGQIGNVSGIRSAFQRHGEAVTARALGILSRAFAGQVLRFGGTIFPGIVAALAEVPPPGGDDELLEMVLAGQEQLDWVRDFEQRAADRSISRRSAGGIVLHEAWSEAAAEVADDDSESAAA